MANKLKHEIRKSQSEQRINKSKKLLIETNKREVNQKISTNCPQSIFIVGMPRRDLPWLSQSLVWIM